MGPLEIDLTCAVSPLGYSGLLWNLSNAGVRCGQSQRACAVNNSTQCGIYPWEGLAWPGGFSQLLWADANHWYWAS